MSPSDGPAFPRLPFVAAVIVTVIAVLGVRLAYLGTVASASAPGGTPRFPLHAQRGSIWDRSGDLVAAERYTFAVFAAPYEILDASVFSGIVAPHLGRDRAEIAALVTDRTQRWVSLDAEVPMATARTLRDLQITGLHLQRRARRAYPLGDEAAHITGFVDAEGHSHYGLEAWYDDFLRGREGSYAGNFGSDPRAFRAPVDGSDLILTIDRGIQRAAARALRDAVAAETATGGSAIVLDARTGAVLASTSVPTYDPADYAAADPEWYRDPVVAALYEPGSVLKAVTVSAAIDRGAVPIGWTYEDEGSISVNGMVIMNWDGLPHGTATLTDLLQQSLNVGAVRVAQALGPDRFYDALAAFGFGALTGVDLASESPGIVAWPDADETWFEGNLATNSFGQGIAATPLQMAAAMAAIANDGRLMRPYLVSEIVSADGQVRHIRPQPVRDVIAPETARRTRRMLADVVSGRVTQAAIPGYTVAGKTGTSQIPTEDGYEEHDTIASFVGMVPADDPRLVILVKVDRPDSVRGSDAAAPVFRTIARVTLETLGIPPDQPGALDGGAP
jgi:cell division protein FtsI/penicillin-binding protein 2